MEPETELVDARSDEQPAEQETHGGQRRDVRTEHQPSDHQPSDPDQEDDPPLPTPFAYKHGSLEHGLSSSSSRGDSTGSLPDAGNHGSYAVDLV
jgi:hypothetical protein